MNFIDLMHCSACALLFARALDRIVKLPVVEGSFLVVSVAVSAVVSELSDGVIIFIRLLCLL